MPKFRKKPIVIEARQFTEESAYGLLAWINLSVREGYMARLDGRTGRLIVPTMRGGLGASIGDWIIRGIGGEFYPCPQEVFSETYEEVQDEAERGEAPRALTDLDF